MNLMQLVWRGAWHQLSDAAAAAGGGSARSTAAVVRPGEAIPTDLQL